MSVSELLNSLISGVKGSINTSMLCRVENVKGKLYDVQPLIKEKPLITNLPVLKRSKLDAIVYEKGDIVLVTFTSHSIDGLEESQGLSDGVIIGLVDI